MSLSPDLDSLVDRGNYRSALLALGQRLSAPDADPFDQEGDLTRFARIARSARFIEGLLEDRRDIHAAILERYSERRADLPLDVSALFAPRSRRARGYDASFPLADRTSSQSGSVRTLLATPITSPPSGGRILHPDDGDERFQRALRSAFRWCEEAFGEHELSGSMRLELIPPPRDGDDTNISGASVGLAAVVAIVAALGHHPIPRYLAFTGLLGEDPRTLEGVNQQTLAAKRNALRQERPWITHLLCPSANRSNELTSSPGTQPQILFVDDTAHALVTTFGDRLGRWIARRAPFGPRRPVARLRPSNESEELKLRLLALFVAAQIPLGIETLERALEAMANGPTIHGFSVGRELRRAFTKDPAERDQASAELLPLRRTIDGFRIREAARSEARDDVAGRRLAEAHRTLTAVLAAMAPRRDDETAELAFQAHVSRDDETRRAALRELALRNDGSGRSAGFDALSTYTERGLLPPRVVASDLRDTGPLGASFALAVQLLPLPTPLAVLAQPLAAASCLGDQLLAAQAVIEVALQILAGAAVTHLRSSEEEYPYAGLTDGGAQLSERPSLGLLREVVEKVYAPRNRAKHTSLPEGPHAAIAQACERLNSSEAQLLSGPVRRLNHALHGFGAWPRLYLGDEASLVRRQGGRDADLAPPQLLTELLQDAAKLVEAIRPVFERHPLVAAGPEATRDMILVGPRPTTTKSAAHYALRGDGGSPDVPLGPFLSPLASDGPATDVVFYRGVVRHAARRSVFGGIDEECRKLEPVVRCWTFDGALPRERRAPAPRPACDLLWRTERVPSEESESLLVGFVPEGGLAPPSGLTQDRPQPLQVLPTPLAIAHRLVDPPVGARDNRSLGTRLTHLDLAFGTLLRTVGFPVLQRAIDNSTPNECPNANHVPPGLTRITKWRLLSQLTALLEGSLGDEPAVQELAGFLVRDDTGAAAWELVDCLQRLEHAVPPMESHLDAIVRLETRLLALFARGPWNSGAAGPRLIVGGPTGTAQTAHGLQERRPLEEPIRSSTPLLAGELAFVWPARAGVQREILRFGPFAFVAAPLQDNEAPTRRRNQKSGWRDEVFWLLGGLRGNPPKSFPKMPASLPAPPLGTVGEFYSLSLDGRYRERVVR